jgi:hypothetical protein
MSKRWRGAGALRQLAKDLLNGQDVRVDTIREADLVLKLALPEARKVKGAGPGHRLSFASFKGVHQYGIYHKDYWFDPTTNRIYGHGAANPHAQHKHINVKLPDGRKAAILIERLQVTP